MTGLIGAAPRRYLVETVVGLVMIPLSLAPIVLYLGRTDDGYLMYLRGRYQLFPPATPALSPQALAAARGERRDGLSGVPVLVYHGIGRETDHAEGEGMVVSRTRFAEQMRMLAGAGFRPITTRDLARYLSTMDERTIPPKPVLITFDDGRSDAMIQADRILADTGMRATMFVIGDAAERNGFYYESTERLAAHARSGRWELANHTDELHHQVDAPRGAVAERISGLVDRPSGETTGAYRVRIAADLDRAQAALEAIGGERPLAFAYPFGDWGAEARPGTEAALRSVVRTRFELAFDQDGQDTWRPALPGDDPMHIHRLQVGDWSGRALLDRLEEGAERSAAVYAERALGYEYSAAELADAGRRVVCAEPSERPIVGRSRLGDRRLVALTFSGGPSPVTPTVLDLLKRKRAVATFFAGGSSIEGRENLLRRALIEGHELGAAVGMQAEHLFPRQLVAADVQSAVDSVEAAIGTRPCLVRPAPNGKAPRLARLAAPLGLGTVLWSVDPADYADASASELARRVLRATKSGSIVVLHDGAGRTATAEALPLVIDGLRARGFRLATVSQLLRAPVDRQRLKRSGRRLVAGQRRPTRADTSTGARALPRRIVKPSRTLRRPRPASRPTPAPRKPAPTTASSPASPAPSASAPSTPATPAPAPPAAPEAPPPPPSWPGRGNGRDWETPPGKGHDPGPPPDERKGSGRG